ncbi:putative component of NuA3 histone acetyltransferase complex [Coemansia sp. Cherry 401B]|nr:putative component of NuA3 histone acetyltransferase complex [Coemansia sp. Cherry 401B]
MPEAKRPRTQTSAEASFPGLFPQTDALSTAYAQATPFPHTRIAPFCSDTLLRGVRDEMLTALHFTQKETDILKYHQSGDLANLDGLSAHELGRLPHLAQLRDALYSSEFRAFVSRVTGCGPLSGSRTDMSTNRYKPGDHLLLHDDVIGDRCVSYIIYLPDPDEGEWASSDGGGLELYGRSEAGAPLASPARVLRPLWNQLVMFAVQPGRTYHAVQEVCGRRERLSIQGWFHLPQPGEPGHSSDQLARLLGSGASSLAQIEARGQGDPGRAFAEFGPAEPGSAVPGEDPADPAELDPAEPDSAVPGEDPADPADLDPADRRALAPLINAEYLDGAVMGQAADRFADASHIQLGAFLRADVAARLLDVLRAADADAQVGGRACVTAYAAGEHADWAVEGPPVVRRFLQLRADAAPAAEPGRALHALQQLFGGAAFARWLAGVSGLALGGRRGGVRRFRAGLDYTLGTPDHVDGPVLDAVLCLAPQAERWRDGGVGGYHCYVDGGGDDASNDGSVCRRDDDDDGTLLTTPAGWNALTLVLREPSVVKFVKYVSAAAPGSRWDVSYEYKVCD